MPLKYALRTRWSAPWLRLLIITAVFLAGCGQRGDKPTPDKVPDGSLIFKQRCVSCHGADGTMGANGAANLAASALPEDETIRVISSGRKGMMPFKTVLSEAEIKAVAQYVMAIRQHNKAHAE